MPRVEIIGIPGSGKTTLADNLGRCGFVVLHEAYRTNPFWPSHGRGELRRLAMEVTFLLQHLDQIGSHQELRERAVCDYSLVTDLAFAKVRLSGSGLDIYRQLHSDLTANIERPMAYVVMLPSAPRVLEQLTKRGRSEEQELLVSMVGRLHSAALEAVDEVTKSSIPTFWHDPEQPHAIASALGRLFSLREARTSG